MTLICPHCQSHRVTTQDVAKKVGGVIGVISGTATGVAAALLSAESRNQPIPAGPSGLKLVGIATAILAGLAGASSAGSTGARLGEVLDQRLLDNYHCLDCGHHFRDKVGI